MRLATILLAIALTLSTAPLFQAAAQTTPTCPHPCGRVCCP
jgi:hypothetical protein